MPLHIVARQLSLFATKLDTTESAELSGRTGNQWLRSVSAYLQWRAGEPWRQLGRPDQRNSPARWDYLHAVRLIETLRHAPAECDKPKPIEVPRPHPSESLAREIEGHSRAKLVSELMKANPLLTDRKLLMRFRSPKLARMLVAILGDEAPKKFEPVRIGVDDAAHGKKRA